LADAKGYAWVDLATAHRFAPALVLEQQPRRVFLCCDPGWPEAEVQLFGKVWDAAIAGGWKPEPGDHEPPTAQSPVPGPVTRPVTAPVTAPVTVPVTEEPVAVEVPTPVETPAVPTGRLFAGVNYGGDMRDPREATWLAILELRDDRLHVVRLDATGRHGVERCLRDPDTVLMHVEAIGLDFPFSVPVEFAERLLGGAFPAEGWWALARKMGRLSRPDYLIAVQEFREQHGESRRHTDERADAFSPLHRVDPDLVPTTFHGIRMIAEDRSRYAVKPFESAKGRLLLEVYPAGLVKRLALPASTGKANGRMRRQQILDALDQTDYLPVECEERNARSCVERPHALDAVIAAQQAAVAVLSGEVERTPEELAPGAADRVRYEGWIYGLERPE
jgi:hypothetical protein